ncbi:DUF4037 domain-containing protein [Neoactinobaculum massilliense]|uniref:DUF4037 domain-containing protein n=1 Tax=Neoactinobaculum massilliense TaxID=2364794 RepID=UPI000F54A72C|nr:DUF4037 domain-containing protein [Neoactinobaculum massilliense]
MDDYVQGLERAEAWWMLDVQRELSENLPDLYPYLAVGLVGDGSDAFGYDDAVSADHDSQTRLVVWYPEGTGAVAERVAASVHLEDNQRIDCHEIHAFYSRYTGTEFAPHTWQEWYAIPEHNLAAATNGRVFYDGGGRFTRYREVLSGFYPDDVRRKLIEKRALIMGQAGQYNYGRCLRHGEPVAANLALARFAEAAISMMFLLNRRYTPYYKWAHRALRELPIGGLRVAELLAEAFGAPSATREIEEISALVVQELRVQGLSDRKGDFLVDHARTIRSLIIEPDLREMNSWKN